MADEKHSIGKTIYQLRTKKGWTQTQLAEKLNVSDKTISKWESDAGSPSLEFFPLLSGAFGVSIDYLMTGKMTSEDKDKLIPKRPPERLDKFSTLLVNNNLQSLEKDSAYRPKGIKYLGYSGDKNKIYNGQYPGSGNFYSYPLSEKFFDLLVNDKRVSKKTIEYLLSWDEGDIWFLGYPYIIQKCYERNTKESMVLLERVIEKSSKNNEEVFVGYPESKNENNGTLYLGRCGIVVISEETIKLALQRGDLENAKRFNDFNKNVSEKSKKAPFRSSIKTYIASEDNFRMSQLDHDKALSEIERHIQKSIHYNILNVRELLDFKDRDKYLDQIIRAIKKYPINQGEYMDGLIADEKWDEVNDFLVVNSKQRPYGDEQRRNFEYILDSDAFKDRDVQATRKLFDDLYKYGKNFRDYRNFLRDYDCETSNEERKKYYWEPYEGTFIEHTKKEKDEIITNLRLEYHMYNKIESLTPEYFHKLMKENKYRDVLIDLCVRLETIFEDKYKYDGDLMEMVEKYCSCGSEDFDDEENEHDENWPYLSKLVRCRNNAVHRNTTNETMTVKEIEWCIDYICKMA